MEYIKITETTHPMKDEKVVLLEILPDKGIVLPINIFDELKKKINEFVFEVKNE